MQGKQTEVEMVMPHAHKLVGRRPLEQTGSSMPSELMVRLRDVRTQLAAQAKVPLYVVASNRTLEEMAQRQPQTRKALLACHGMGEVRTHRFGGPLLECVRHWQREQDGSPAKPS
jgi:ATP-dependent DNA helicase RecQ